MTAGSNWMSRQLRWLTSGRNPLATGWDRLETGLVVLAMLLSLGALPVALTLGSQVYAHGTAEAAEQAATRVGSTAVLLSDAPDTTGVHSAAKTEQATGVWRLPDGSERTGQVAVEPGSAAGAKVPIWLDRTGNPVDEPLRPQDALGAGIGVAVLAWVGVTGTLALLLWAARFALDRRRDQGWTRDWEQLSRDLKRF
jgi:hypothetical protein